MNFIALKLTLALVASSIAALAGITVLNFAYLEAKVIYWDRRIDQLCLTGAKDVVGLKVYEQVIAPASYISGPSIGLPGQIRVPFESKYADPQAPIVQRYVELEVLNKSNPKVSKHSVQILRKHDQKILGEEIHYVRSGGGMPMPTPKDVHTCPPSEATSLNTSALLSKVFLNHPIKGSP